MALLNPWMLDDWVDVLDVSEDEFGEIQVRDHWTLTRHKKQKAQATFRSDVGDAVKMIRFNVGNVSCGKLNTGAGSYLITSDGISPEQPGTPGDYVFRRQSMEYFSAWRDAPEEWRV